MLILTTIFLVRQQEFNSATLLRTLAYSVALSVRQAQVYGTSVRETDPTALNPTFAPGHGLYFTGTNPTTYTLFADIDNDNRYDTGESLEVFTLPRGYRINGVCAVRGDGVRRCTTAALDSSGGATIDELHVFFRRPNPDAIFGAYFGGSSIPGDTYVSGYVQVVSGSGTTRSVTVTSTGQIQVGGLGT